MLEDRLELLCDDKGATHMANLTRLNGVVHLYVVHEMIEPEIINMIEGVGMGEVGPSKVNDVVNCVNEGHEHGAGEVLEKEGGEGEEDVAAKVVVGNANVDEVEGEKEAEVDVGTDRVAVEDPEGHEV